MLRRSIPLLTFALVLGLTSSVPTRAQHRLQPVAALNGRPALELILRKLDTVGNLMMTTAHPDDENNALLAYYGHSKGFRTSLVTATRGEGGQNEIGPELFEALAVLRTEELLAAHRYDGAEQYFTSAVDFGFSFSVEESLEKWGGQVILGDYVRMIRIIRPDVIVGFVYDGEGGGQHHQASARLSAQAFRAAADPNAFPDQIAAGLREWQAKKYYYTAGFFGPPGKAPALTGDGASSLFVFREGDTYDPLLGRTCNEIAGEARSMHKCQGMSQLLPLPGVTEGFGSGPRAYRLRDTVLTGGVNRADPEMFDGVDTSLAGLAGYAGAQPPAALTAGLTRVASAAADARTALAAKGSAAALAPLGAGLAAVRTLRTELATLGLNDSARYEIDVRLARKVAQFEQRAGAGGRRSSRGGRQRRPGRGGAAGAGAGDRRQPRRHADHRRGDAGRLDGARRRLRRDRRRGPGLAQLPLHGHRAGRCAAHRRALQVRHRRRALRARPRRGARAAVPANPVCRHRWR